MQKKEIRKIRHSRLLKDESGQALLELALTIPVLAALLLGMAEVARVTYGSIEVTNAAKAAVQYGAQDCTTAADTTGMQLAATNEAKDVALGTTSVSPSYTCSDGTTPSGTPLACSSSTAMMETVLTVNTQATINPLIHVSFLPVTFTVRGQAVQKCTQC